MKRLTAVCALLLLTILSMGAGYRSRNFLVTAESEPRASEVARRAEELRRELASHWLGEALPDWPAPCVIEVEADAAVRPGGSASFTFGTRGLCDIRLRLSGPWRHVLDSVLPHELSHVILACHFRRPLPRWADEGACMMVENEERQIRHQQELATVLHSGRGIELARLLDLLSYPADAAPLYSMGHSLTSFLVARGGERAFVGFLRDGLDGNWSSAALAHYGFGSLEEMQETWLAWAMPGI